MSTHRRWWCHASLTAGGDRSSRRCRGCDGASRHGQTHSSCPRATTRLITAERRVDTVELTRLSLASALPALAGGSSRSMTRWKSARRAKRKRNDRGRELRDIESTASCRGRQTRGGSALLGWSLHLVDPICGRRWHRRIRPRRVAHDLDEKIYSGAADTHGPAGLRSRGPGIDDPSIELKVVEC